MARPGGGPAEGGASRPLNAMAALRALLPFLRGPLRPWPSCPARRSFASGECGTEGRGPDPRHPRDPRA